jgi:fructose transport system ATP-binding protein
MDQEGQGMSADAVSTTDISTTDEATHHHGSIFATTEPSANKGEPVLSARGLVKTFGRVVGLDGVDLDLYPGEVLAVIGDNGAGKSTLIKCLTGALVPDSGEMRLDGQVVHFKRPQDSRDAGIETVYQQLAVIPALDIASNLYLAREERRPGPLGSVLRMLDKKGMKERAGKAVQDLGIQTIQNMGQAVETLSGGQRQAVAVSRAAAFGGKVVILDEPTAALGVAQTRQVLDLVRRLADTGHAVVFITHNMIDVFEVSDRVAALYLGHVAADVPISEVDRSQVIELITAGRSGNLGIAPAVAEAGV